MTETGLPLPPPPDDGVRRRGDRWAIVVVTMLGLGSVIPLATTIADQSEVTIRERAVSLGARLDTAATTTAAERYASGQGALAFGALALGGLVAAALFVLRRVCSARYVAAVRERRPARSVALSLSVALWVVIGITTTAVFAITSVTERPADMAEPLGDAGWMLLLAPAGIGVAAAFSWWRHRRRWELQPLLALGLAHVEPPPPDPSGTGISQGVWAFTRAAAIESGFVGAAYVQGLLSDESPSFGDAVGNWIINISFLPGAVSAVFVVTLLLLPHLRWTVRAALGRSSSIVALLLLFGGLGGNAISEEGSATATAFGVAMLLGGLIASVTGLGIQDTGPQPWLGLLFLIFVFAMSFATPEGELGLPSGAFAWAATVVIAALTAWEGRKHWRESYRPIRIAPIAPEGGAF